MTGNIKWDNIFLKKNPFDLTPSIELQQIIWAGMEGVKKQFQHIYDVALNDTVTQVVLNQGPWGGGKTHASYYFGNEKNLTQKPDDKQINQYRISVPKEPGKPAEDFYIDVLDTIGMRNVHSIIRKAICNLSEDEAFDQLQEVLGSEEIARAFWLFGTEDDIEKLALLRTYFLNGVTNTELKKLRIARNITNSQDRFRVLACVLRCLIGFKSDNKQFLPTRVCLWIDEMEDLLYLTSAQFRIVSQGLRDMIDRLPNNFTLFLNMTLTNPEAHEEFDIILGGALINRVTDVIYFQELSHDESIHYVNELINHPQHRITSNKLKELSKNYPFEDAVLKTLLDSLEKKTPRDINKRCRNVLYSAFRANKFTSPGEGIIDSAFVGEFDESELDREIL